MNNPIWPAAGEQKYRTSTSVVKREQLRDGSWVQRKKRVKKRATIVPRVLRAPRDKPEQTLSSARCPCL